MNKKLFLALQNWFNNYVDQYSFSNPKDQENIDLKFKHSYKVCNRMTDIAKEILPPEELYTAKTIALFHDLGRFEQYKRYKTFADAKSEDHAALGVKILKDNNIFTEVDQSTTELILKAITYHNQATLPQTESKKCLVYSKLIRDADKLDIWRVVLKEYNSPSNNSTVGLGLADKPKISDEIYQQLMREEVINYQDLKTLNDFKLLQMGWVYDINFKESFRIIKEKDYIDRLFKTLPDTKKAKRVYDKINSYLNQKL
ncbi:putative domain HDIG-containing protein [Halobacteroides halobius DSM 5150]|uniref:Putative domain HDIG-containing protein n=1 Tax=Halobacteroides halobius (strain ATCC 35273 / DSM 5150 / MD-1) TaxID=748449 RepID=L0K642_HALHC|nr:HD domain-containing protein [Halobacteroides halobius]AGB40737.1 putative domain HDIG-containing protein [Halobacteroides halobius DSM 5150]